MRHFISLVSLAILFSCNGNKDTVETHTDSTHNVTVDTPPAADTTASKNPMMEMHDAMNGMMEQMKSMKPSGDADYDFAMMMKHHHQGAINMAKAEIAGGTDNDLKQMAQKMIDEQQKEIAMFDTYMQGNQPAGNSDYGKKAMGMMTPMSDIKMESGTLDAMFASMMIPHHQDAVKMAREYLKVAKNADLKKSASTIIETQPKEIEKLKQWLAAHK